MTKATEAQDMKLDHYSLPVHIYNQEIIIFTKLGEFEKFAEQTNLTFNCKVHAGMAVMAKDADGLPLFIMYVPREPEPNWEVVAHEAYHMTSMIFDTVGIKHDPENDEPGAYLIGYIVGQIQAIYAKEIEEEEAAKKAARKARAKKAAPKAPVKPKVIPKKPKTPIKKRGKKNV